MRAQLGISVVFLVTFGAGSIWAQDTSAGKEKKVTVTKATKKSAKGSSPEKSPPEEAAGKQTAASPETPASEKTATPPASSTTGEVPVSPETSLEACRDDTDNDRDGLVDCADEDCQIYAICVGQPSEPVENVQVVKNFEDDAPPEQIVPTETGRRCRDKLDNDDDGLIDCHDDTCQRYAYCQRLMYETTMAPNRPPALYLSLGAGLALPNYRSPTAETRRFAPYYRKIPFDPDVGVTAGMKIGFFFLKWLGAGVNFSVTGSGATNRQDGFFTRDDPDIYRYYGTKIAGHVGGFVRLQWPLKRFVPFLDVAAGYSVSKYTWDVYDPDTSWSVITDQDDDEWLAGEDSSIEYEVISRHFTFALEPGFDVFVVKRVFAIGARAWFPVVASNESSTDNVGILMHFTVTPLWRGPKRLKAEYQKAGDL